MARQAIRHEGDNAEQIFLHLVKDSRSSPIAKRGDAQVAVDNKWHFVEIKECHSTNGTINQIRAIKFIPLIIYAPEHEQGRPWVVVPAHKVVSLVLPKSRGQHTEIPFECANLPLRGFVDFLCTQQELEQKVIEAIRNDMNYIEVKEFMKNLYTELRELDKRTKEGLSKILSRTK